jgi:ABC-type uncharacterized transport system permease subunit
MKEIRYAQVQPGVNTILAILFAMVVGGVIILSIGKNPLVFYRELFAQGMGSSLGVIETLIKMTPFLFLGASLLVAFSAGLWNIGGDGQFLMGAVLVGWFGPSLALHLPLPAFLICMAGLGAAGGMACVVLPAVLKARYDINEIITTLMMTFITINFVTWLAKGPIKDPTVVPPQTVAIPVTHRMPMIPLTRIHIGLIAGLVILLGTHWVLKRTTMGYRLRVFGTNKRAAIHAGMSVTGITISALLVSGALAGLAGASDILGIKFLYQGDWNPSYGFTCFCLVFLARLNGWAVIPLAYFFSFLAVGGEFVARDLGIPIFFVHLLEGLMLLFFAASEYIERRR